MITPNDAIEQLAGALEGLLQAKNAWAERLLYHEHRESIRNEVVVEQCHACDGVDGHEEECVVGIAERVLRRV